MILQVHGIIMVIFYMKLGQRLVRLSAIINVKWVYEIGAKDVTGDAGYL